ncbi:MFS transporter [Nocardiopsis dassonvillei]|uniref:Major facilitator superfamily MFS_1 n=1 Tax=Nocardiopsis dassonvillei (strain ATCC 23218 / DSM 43111 / CIP 107115 / JCM 7437 / KCTC 9190 / NBRC 14626 / NCTC 10488 / NRRL B-5397 / IMRU 509) TaxID=446468 RepID=D7B5A5_NOCDD|nr:major facilitator superfamily MFS_1 [Nocardiopsis dassonvillei subsp. dassonvillei DSM 43111]APC35406.1 MFS transporter [Nocardiopsis dassonvillei]VEI87174.1 enterobactin exporter EntS [Nocardiopsis dassonvillei]
MEDEGRKEAGAPPVDVPLRRNRRFQLLWVGSAFSFFGLEVSELVYPLVVLALTGSPAWAGAFGGVQMVATLLAALPAGELCDRYDRRALLLLAEGTRAAATLSVVAALLFATLTLPHLLVVAALLGLVTPLGGSARMLLVRAVVPREQLTSALTQEEVRSNGAAMAGPPLGGFLYAVSMATPFVFTTVTFVLSVVCVLFVRPVPPRPGGSEEDADGSAWTRMLSGLRTMAAATELRRVLLFTVLMNAVSAPFLLISVVVLEEQGASSTVIGFAMMGLAAGGLVGAFLVKPLHRLLPPGGVMLAVGGSTVLLIALFAVPWGPWWLAALLFLLTVGVPAMRILVDLLIFRQVSDEIRGRVIAAAMTLYGVGGAVGMAGAGLLLEFLRPGHAVLTLAAVLAVCVLLAFAHRGFRTMAWPVESADGDGSPERSTSEADPN